MYAKERFDLRRLRLYSASARSKNGNGWATLGVIPMRLLLLPVDCKCESNEITNIDSDSAI